MATAFDYSGLATTAETLIDRFGRNVTFTRKNYFGEAVSGKPWRGPSIGTSTFSVKAVVYDYDDRAINGDTVKLGDRRVLVSADALAAAGWGDGTTWSSMDYPWGDAASPWDTQESAGPDLDDTMLDGGRNYKVVRALPIKPGGSTLVYELQVRGGTT